MRHLVALIALLALVGCSSSSTLDTSYGHPRGKSINGTGALSELFGERGHEVRTAVRLTDELDKWADVIVRFAPYPGPPEREEGDWFSKWLRERPGRVMIYVPRDYDGESDYWSAVVNNLSQDADPRVRARAEKLRDRHRNWADRIPERPKAKDVADALHWFAVEPAQGPPLVCKTLGGPWSEGIDPARAALPRHDALKADAENVLLAGQGKPLVMNWTVENGNRVFVAANAAFLVNAALANPARRPLALRMVDAAGEPPRRVAFVEGSRLLKGGMAEVSIWDILQRFAPFRWVTLQMLVLGLAACLSRAARLGKPRPEPPSGADRPVAHPLAIGTLLARAGRAEEARAILDAYRRQPSVLRTQSSPQSEPSLKLEPRDP